MTKRITIAKGDGIGPEIMDATLKILEAAQVDLAYDEIQVGEKVYLSGQSNGIKDEDWNKLVENAIFLKAPITTPQGGGFKSINVTIRKSLSLYANVRPVRAYSPYVKTKHPKMDMVIIRENEEDLYGGIEHRQTNEVYQCLKLITKPGTERIIRYAFEYAKQAGRKKVTCMTKDNIMKLTDGLFHKMFDDIGKEYPEIEKDHYIIDIGTARLADTPEIFDVIVLPNLYGDILSDVAAQIAGSVGLAGSANHGEQFSMFEAIHGSAPDIAGKNIANPSGLLLAATQMLSHLGFGEKALMIQNAWLKTIEDGIHTGDIYNEETSTKKVSTTEFTQAVIERFNQAPSKLPAAQISQAISTKFDLQKDESPKVLDGVDFFLHELNRNPKELGERLTKACESTKLKLQMITNRGVQVFPRGSAQTFCTDHWRCRFVADGSESKDIATLYSELIEQGFNVIKTENLYSFGEEKGYSLGQGQ